MAKLKKKVRVFFTTAVAGICSWAIINKINHIEVLEPNEFALETAQDLENVHCQLSDLIIETRQLDERFEEIVSELDRIRSQLIDE